MTGGVPGVLDLIVNCSERLFMLFRLPRDSAVADPVAYEYCRSERVPHFARLAANAVLNRLLGSYPTRLRGTASRELDTDQAGVFCYQAAFARRHGLRIAFDDGAEGVVGSNSGK